MTELLCCVPETITTLLIHYAPVSDGSDGKVSVCNGGVLGFIPGLGRSPGRGNGNPLQYSCLENPHGQRSLVDTVHGVTKSRT